MTNEQAIHRFMVDILIENGKAVSCRRWKPMVSTSKPEYTLQYFGESSRFMVYEIRRNLNKVVILYLCQHSRKVTEIKILDEEEFLFLRLSL